MIPEHRQGKRVDCSSASEFENANDAQEFFTVAKRRLLNINKWNEVAVLPSSIFQITDNSGRELYRSAQQGDLVKIDIIGPGLPSSEGFDWVQVEQILEEETAEGRQITITLRPIMDPTNPNQDVAHFFKNVATSTFVLQQTNTQVLAKYAGRNEIINDENDDILDNIRNLLIGLAAKLGGSVPQWKALVAGIVKVNQ